MSKFDQWKMDYLSPRERQTTRQSIDTAENSDLKQEIHMGWCSPDLTPTNFNVLRFLQKYSNKKNNSVEKVKNYLEFL